MCTEISHHASWKLYREGCWANACQILPGDELELPSESRKLTDTAAVISAAPGGSVVRLLAWANRARVNDDQAPAAHSLVQLASTASSDG